MAEVSSAKHAKLMDRTYRHQRLIYDLTRKYYLFGRDHLIANLGAEENHHVLEIACGTGRNLQLAARKYPNSAFYGLDISSEMLVSARAKLKNRAQLAQADACDFDSKALFQRTEFDRIFISYGVSMIPDWETALRVAYSHLAPGGELHVVDFSDMSGWPNWCERTLNRWLEKFHVSPRLGLQETLHQIATEFGATAHHQHLYGSYAQYGVVTR